MIRRVVAALTLIFVGIVGAGAVGCYVVADKPLQGAVLILLDTVRPDHLGTYGYARPTSPNIDALAKDGVVFDQAVSCAPWTLASVAAILSGRYPSTDRGEDVVVTTSLVERLRAAGYRTAGFTEGGYVSRKFGMDRGFETYAEDSGVIIAPKPTGGIANTFRQAHEWLAAHKDERFFLLIHTYEAHAPYTNRDFATGMDPGRIGDRFSIELLPELQSGRMTLTPGEIEYVKALYDSDILNADRYVGRFVDFVRSLGLDDRTLLVVASDHGEEMGEHYVTNIGDHGHSLYDNLLLVPLIIRDPTHAYATRRVAPQVRTIDILPTILDLLRAPADSAVDGTSLVPVMNRTSMDDRPVVSGWNHKGPLRASLRDRGVKYVTSAGVATIRYPLLNPPPDHELFDLRTDPDELENVYDSRPSVATAMDETLASRRRDILKPDHPAPALVDHELDERLKSLGYVQ